MLANRLKILLAERDLTIKNVIEAVHLSRPSVSNMVNNPFANISTENIDKLCNYLGITPKDFFDYSGWIINFEFIAPMNEGEGVSYEPCLKITMESSTGIRLSYPSVNFNEPFSDPAGNYFGSIGIDDTKETFPKIYAGLSPVFQHQLTRKMTVEARKARDYFDQNASKTHYVFNYSYNGKFLISSAL